jgi:hypothetical protein
MAPVPTKGFKDQHWRNSGFQLQEYKFLLFTGKKSEKAFPLLIETARLGTY